MRRILSILVLMSMIAGSSDGMTLRECLSYAREHAYKNVLSRIEIEKARSRKLIVASGFTPEVFLSSGGNISFGRNIDPETNIYDNKRTLSTAFSLQLSLPVFDGLVTVNNLKAARIAELRQMKSSETEEDRISIAVVKAFYNVIYCRAMVGQMESQLQRDCKNLRAVEEGERLGVKSGADVAEMRSIVAADEYELTNQSNLLEKARLQLKGEMGMDLSTPAIEVSEEEDVWRMSAEGFVNPRIAEAQMSLLESEYRYRAAKGAFMPRLSLSGGVSTSYYKMMGSGLTAPGFSKQWKDNMGQYVGLSLTIPIFNGTGDIHRLRYARTEVIEQKVRLEETEYEIEKEIADARLDYESAIKECKSASLRYEAEELAFNAVQRKFELGGVSALDLYTSGAKLATARANLEGKRIQRIISGILLNYYLSGEIIANN